METVEKREVWNKGKLVGQRHLTHPSALAGGHSANRPIRRPLTL
jgi:hypothetical protein